MRVVPELNQRLRQMEINGWPLQSFSIGRKARNNFYCLCAKTAPADPIHHDPLSQPDLFLLSSIDHCGSAAIQWRPAPLLARKIRVHSRGELQRWAKRKRAILSFFVNTSPFQATSQSRRQPKLGKSSTSGVQPPSAAVDSAPAAVPLPNTAVASLPAQGADGFNAALATIPSQDGIRLHPGLASLPAQGASTMPTAHTAALNPYMYHPSMMYNPYGQR